MTNRHIRTLTVLAAFVAGLVLSLGVILIVRDHTAGPGAPAAAIGGPFRLTDQDGHVMTEEDLKGRPSLVFFGFTHCPDVCPTTLFDISQIMQALGPDADRTRAVFITVDPERDTQDVLKDYLSSFDPASDRPHRRPAVDYAGRQGVSRLLQEGAARRRRLHHGPHRHHLSDGQGRPLRLALQS